MKNKGAKIQQLIEENFSQKEDHSEEEYEEDNLVKRTVNTLLDEKIEDFPNDDAVTNFTKFQKSFPDDDFLTSKKYHGKRVSRKAFEESGSEEDDGDSNVADSSEIDENSETNESETDDRDDDDEAEGFKKNLKITKRVTFADPLNKSRLNTNNADCKKILKKPKKVSFNEFLNGSDTGNEKTKNAVKKTKRVTFDISSNSDLEEEFSQDDSNTEESDENVEESEADDSEDENVEDESDIEDDLSDDETHDASFLYSKAVRDEDKEMQKGEAIRNQLNICEVLLESRITLQKALLATNQLPKPKNYEKIWSQCSEEEKNEITECREGLWDLLEKFIRFQCKFRKQSPEFLETLDDSVKQEYNELDDSEPKVKRRKLSEYPEILEKLHSEYKPYRNNVLQKWSDRTRITSGKFAKKDFSAFELPILKQIEQITADKQRLIQKTQVKRSDYKIIGDEISNEHDQENPESNQNDDYDAEIFDDDDFYHKLLRDYIERKTADVSDPTQLGRKWIKLQSLRSKMKRKIDTRRTKGRKIKFDVHPKLVNFMAPNTLDLWTDTAVNELFSSIFSKNLINS